MRAWFLNVFEIVNRFEEEPEAYKPGCDQDQGKHNNGFNGEEV